MSLGLEKGNLAPFAHLGSLLLDFFVDGIFIFGDRLFLMDKLRGAQFKEYRIKD